MHTPRRDNRGILQPDKLNRQVRFRRHCAASPLRSFVEHYWLIDWALDAPFTQYVVPHPCVNAVWYTPGIATVSGVDSRLIAQHLEGNGRALGVQFRPGGFAALFRHPVGVLNNRQIPVARLFTQPTDRVNDVVFSAAADQERVAAVDEFLLGLETRIDDDLMDVMRWAHLARTDRRIRRVDDLAMHAGTSIRSLQRRFASRVGVSPKWVIRRYRIHEAIERAHTSVDWARLASELGYADQAHLVREFTAACGVSPTKYARLVASQPTEAAPAA